MSDAKAFGFGQFIPGYDFLQQLTQASQGSSLPPFSSWVAPTVSVEEIDKRIEELKAVQFWLEQNNRALSATVQALQVQKMTLSTLKGMNVNLTDFAQAFGVCGRSQYRGFAVVVDKGVGDCRLQCVVGVIGSGEGVHGGVHLCGGIAFYGVFVERFGVAAWQ